MKKFIRSKIDTEITNRAAPDPPPPSNICISEQTRSEVQPPLPPGPPPPDEDYTLHVKQEIEDDEYKSNTNKTTSNELQKPVTNCENSTPEESEASKVPICRDYVRGTCKRPGTCKYAHKFDLTQLVGVYTFCRNYQFSVCTYPNCKYVHATTFEEHHFYRTGILPPHAFAHYNNVDVMQPPITLNTNVSMNSTSTNLPPPLQNERSATLKRQWSVAQISNSPSDRDSDETIAKKCKHCDDMDFRLQYNKYKVKKMLHAKEKANQMMCLLEKKSEKLCTIISELLSPSEAQSHNNRLGSSLDDIKNKTLLKHLKNIFTVSNRPFAFGEDI